MLERVRFLGLSALGSSTPSDAYSTEAEGLRDQILGTVNTSFQGRFIFGGSDGVTQPFQKDGAGVVTYNGDSDVVQVQVGRAATLQTQIPGTELFGAGNDVFQALTDLIDAMKTGVKSDIDAKLKPLEAAWDGLSVSRSRVGSLVNVASSISDEMSALSLARETSLVDLESADLTETLTEFQAYQTVLQSTLAVGARISQLSLLDYLRQETMKAIETLDHVNRSVIQGQETIIHFEEGSIGFSDFKSFNLSEHDYLEPFRLLGSVDSPDIGFLVLDPTTRVPEYCHLIPNREGASIGVTDRNDRLAFVTVILGQTAEQCTGNFPAPLLINYREMIGRQIILTDSDFSVRQPLV